MAAVVVLLVGLVGGGGTSFFPGGPEVVVELPVVPEVVEEYQS